MNLKQLERKYRWAALWYDATRWIYIRGRSRAVRELRLNPGASVLEIGCGTGLNFGRLALAVGPNGRIVGLDFVRPMLQQAILKARQIMAANQAHVWLVQADGAELPLANGWDAVLFSYSLTMIPQWRRALAEAIRVLKPGGRMMALDFSDARWWPPGLRHLLTGWLRWHGVDVSRDFPQLFTASGLSDVREIPLYGHYVRLVIGIK